MHSFLNNPEGYEMTSSTQRQRWLIGIVLLIAGISLNAHAAAAQTTVSIENRGTCSVSVQFEFANGDQQPPGGPVAVAPNTRITFTAPPPPGNAVVNIYVDGVWTPAPAFGTCVPLLTTSVCSNDLCHLASPGRYAVR